MRCGSHFSCTNRLNCIKVTIFNYSSRNSSHMKKMLIIIVWNINLPETRSMSSLLAYSLSLYLICFGFMFVKRSFEHFLLQNYASFLLQHSFWYYFTLCAVRPTLIEAQTILREKKNSETQLNVWMISLFVLIEKQHMICT
jgi:hypothetical protein